LTGGPVADQADAVLGVLVEALPRGSVCGVYLYGSAVAGGLRPDSDLDLFAVVDRRLTDAERRAVLDGLLPISGRATRPPEWRPVELTIMVHDEVRPWRYPPRVELQYGEWLRADALAGTLEPRPASPDAAILLTMVRDEGQSLLGPPATVLLDPVPSADVRRAIREEMAPILEDLETDTRNVLLTLARMWATVATGSILSKDAAAWWAIGRLPLALRPVLERARAAYLGDVPDTAYDPRAVRALAAAVIGELRRSS
jgi:streptomycin 3"-adenylyltransferase